MAWNGIGIELARTDGWVFWQRGGLGKLLVEPVSAERAAKLRLQDPSSSSAVCIQTHPM